MSFLKSTNIIGAVSAIIVCLPLKVDAAFPSKQEVVDTMILLNDHWLDEHTNPDDNK